MDDNSTIPQTHRSPCLFLEDKVGQRHQLHLVGPKLPQTPTAEVYPNKYFEFKKTRGAAAPTRTTCCLQSQVSQIPVI